MEQLRKKILIFGGSGLLGSVFQDVMRDGYEIIAPNRKEADIRDFSQILQIIALSEPDMILNFASYTDVAGAEGEGRFLNFEINALGAQNIAKAAGAFALPFIHLSSDYVFDGEKGEPYLPSDIRYPINNYGVAKYLSEVLVRREYGETIIVRTSSLYGGPLYGESGVKRHFINSLLRNATLEKELKVINDVFMSPTSALDLSRALGNLIENIESSESDILHLVNETEGKGVSWYDFALECAKYLPDFPKIFPISLNEYPSGGIRPKNSTLNNTSTILLPDWKESLKTYLS